MFKLSNRLSIYLFFILCFLVQLQCHAQHERIKAVTVENKNLTTDVKTNDTLFDPELPQFDQRSALSDYIEQKIKDHAAKKAKKDLDLDQDITDDSIEQTSDKQDETSVQEEDVPTGITSPDNSIEEQQIPLGNRFKINADKVTYDENDGNVYADGHVEIIAEAQDIKILADNAVLEKENQLIKLLNNVKIVKEGVVMTGEYLTVDLNEQNILMDNPDANAYQLHITAQEGYIVANDLEMLNGTIKSNSPKQFALYSNGFMATDASAMYMSFDQYQKYALERYNTGKTTPSYKLNAREIVINSYKDHNSLVFKDADIYYRNHKIARKADLEFLTDKSRQIYDVGMPEGGSFRGFGTYVGYSFINRMPKGHILKVVPAVVYGNSNFGVGVLGRYRTPNSMIEAGWNTATTDIVVNGRYQFGEAFALRYGRHAYINEGFLGRRRSGYAAQLEYEKSYNAPQIDVNFSHAVYAGMFSDYKKHTQEKDVYATSRFRYMASLSRDFIKYQNEEQDFAVRLGLLTNGAATLYGSGQTTGIVRIGPTLTTKFKKWDSNIAYMMSGVTGDSPFNFDRYRYGRTTIMFSERFDVSKHLAFGFRLYVTPKKDNPEKDLLTEARVFAVFGPEELKFLFSYDFVRDIAQFDVMLLVGSESSKINFERLITNDIDGKKERQDLYRSNKKVKIITPEENI